MTKNIFTKEVTISFRALLSSYNSTILCTKNGLSRLLDYLIVLK